MRWICLTAPVMALVAGCAQESSMSADENAMDVEMAAEEAPEQPKILCPAINVRITEEECADVTALKSDVRPGAAALDVPNPMTRGRSTQVTLIIDRRPLSDIRKLEAEAEAEAEPEPSTPDPDSMNAVDSLDGNAVATPGPAPSDDVNMVVNTNGEDTDVEAAPTPEQSISELPGQDYGFRSEVGRFMRASLAGQGFKIQLISPEDAVLEIPAGGQGSWMWEVTPTQGGVRSLTVKTEAIAVVNDKQIPLGNGQTSKTVMVDVHPIDSVKDFLVALPDWLKLISGALVAATALVIAWFQFRKSLRSKDG